MPALVPPTSFALPTRKSSEQYVVTLADGRTVLRAKHELAKAPKR